MTDIAEVLEKAAALIEPEGAWTQGHYGDGYSEDGGYNCLCMYGAICEAADGGHPVRAIDIVEEVLGTSLIRWNDARGRTQAEVVAKLREAAQKAREQAS